MVATEEPRVFENVDEVIEEYFGEFKNVMVEDDEKEPRAEGEELADEIAKEMRTKVQESFINARG